MSQGASTPAVTGDVDIREEKTVLVKPLCVCVCVCEGAMTMREAGGDSYEHMMSDTVCI